MSSSSPIVLTSGCRLGEIESFPAGMPRIFAISGVTLASRQDAALARLGALREFQLEHLDAAVRPQLFATVRRKAGRARRARRISPSRSA